jgi:Flp pilus assembly CpaF family ATPase
MTTPSDSVIPLVWPEVVVEANLVAGVGLDAETADQPRVAPYGRMPTLVSDDAPPTTPEEANNHFFPMGWMPVDLHAGPGVNPQPGGVKPRRASDEIIADVVARSQMRPAETRPGSRAVDEAAPGTNPETGCVPKTGYASDIDPVATLADVAWADDRAVDWTGVAQLRQEASTRLSNRVGATRLTPTEQQTLGRTIIADLLEERASNDLILGLTPPDARRQARLGQAVFDALFRLGRLQPLVEDDSIENIIINGADTVWIESADGRLTRGPAVADSDQELIDFLCFIAARSEANERSFSPAEPRLHLRLDSGARLAAAAWVTPRPCVVIRRHRLQHITLADLTARRTMTAQLASFLAAAVKRRASIVVSGAQGAGKTTLMRALCAEIPTDEIIGTFETEYELGLHLMPERHRIVYAWEARPGSGEFDAAGRRAGEYLLDDALYDSFRFNLARQIVGEVRGQEILAMLKAMQSGSGSLSTTHASSAEAAVHKLITCAMEAGAHVTAEYATRAITEAVSFVVQMDMTTTQTPDGHTNRHRWVREVLALQPSDSARGYSTTRVFSTAPGDQIATPETIPHDYAEVLSPGLGGSDTVGTESPW